MRLGPRPGPWKPAPERPGVGNMPRIPGVLWMTPNGQGSRTTGCSHRMPAGMDDAPLRSQRPKDLQPFEEGVAGSFDALERHDAPPAVRRALTAARPIPAGHLLRVPLGAWGLASAALLLLALGGAIYVELSDPIGAAASGGTATTGVEDLTIVEDSRMALFHDVETFDDVGLAPGRLIADWGR